MQRHTGKDPTRQTDGQARRLYILLQNSLLKKAAVTAWISFIRQTERWVMRKDAGRLKDKSGIQIKKTGRQICRQINFIDCLNKIAQQF